MPPDTGGQLDPLVPAWPRKLLTGFARTLMLVALLFFVFYWLATRPAYFSDYCSCQLPFMFRETSDWLSVSLFHVVLWSGVVLSALWLFLVRIWGLGTRARPVTRIHGQISRICWQATAALAYMMSLLVLVTLATYRSNGSNWLIPESDAVIEFGWGGLLISWTLYVSASVTIASLATDLKWPMDTLYVYAIVAFGCAAFLVAQLTRERSFVIESIGLTASAYVLVCVLGAGALLWAQDASSKASRSNLGAAIIGGGVIAFVIFAQQDAADQGREEQAVLNALRTQQDLTGADLRGRDLSAMSLRGRQLRDANLTGTQLSGADLSRARLADALLVGSLFSDAKLANADMSHAEITCADFYNADLRGANLSDVTVDVSVTEGKAELGEDKARNNGFSLSRNLCETEDEDLWSTISFERADLRNTTLKNADLRRASFCGADLRGADLTQARLYLLESDATSTKFYARFHDAKFDATTLWPPRFQPEAIQGDSIGSCGIYDGT
ncbi:hypothetical protein GCM10009556_079600 [Acrocarpospora pleiomorpha]|uniref:pentapeptide repeat-containing protein n=1 Tax=Acrocarpospora pleiomorpha TaxID=90975 RepID=UPI001478D1AA|nr:pentapeptide repeat-containing protein [Acrocarpospora pleiomorpha]